ncbi:MAG: glycosyltransferase, partial [Lachnospiraceae bacterium]|nr:glycosyltransferase [Lachnospiraceae bacterium]
MTADKVWFRMTIDVIIPVYRPDEKLKSLLKGLAEQSVKPDNIIIMYTRTDGNDHLAPEYIDEGMKACTEFKLYELDRSEFDHGGTRAAALRHSESDIFIMMTMDAVPYDERLIEKLIAVFDKDRYVAEAYARQLPDENSSLAERFTRGFNYPETSMLKSRDDIDTLG